MNRSTGLLRAYCHLLRRVSGARSVSVYAPATSEGNPVFVSEGEPPLPEHENLARAQSFAASREISSLKQARVESAAPGWLTPVPCMPFGRTGQSDERRKSLLSASEDGRHAWIGLRFAEGDEGRRRSAEAFRLLRGSATADDDGDRWSSLLGLGGALAWYAWQISSILDDPVTGLAGRTEFQARLSQACEEASASRRPLSLLLVNPDHFNSVNERFGHEAGDQVLRDIGARLRTTQRSSDSIAKYGGAIFASFLTETDLDSARIVAEKVFTSLSSTAYLDDTVRLNISVGVAVYSPDEPDFGGHLELIRRADKALNAAKRLGGGHVVCWEPELESTDLGNVDRMTGVYTGNMSKDYRNMTLLSDTMTAVAGSTDVEELAEQVVDRLFATLKADHVGVFEWDDNRSPVLLEGISKRFTADGGVEPVNQLELGRRQIGLLEDAERERKPLMVSFSDDFSDFEIRAFAVPLVLGDDCLGCLYIDGREDSIALEGVSELGFLRAFATQLAVALDRARLSEQQKRIQAREHSRLRAEVDDLKRALKHAKLSYRSAEMDSVLETVRRVAPTRATVLVIGESGTGKELVARTIHELSPLRNKPIVVVDCSAIPMTLIESELFGHERGAYTGAQERRIGRLVEAEGGTVVLDEIGELPLEVQSKLLRFVQERQVVPVGGTRVRHVDTRLIAVTNRELSVEAAAGRFREDLYYRLNVVRITVPPLRERVDDILHLAGYFLEHFAEQYQKSPLRFSEGAVAGMLEHHWPGNVRELQNRVMQAVILSEGPEIGLRELELDPNSPDQTREMDLSIIRRSATALAPRKSAQAGRAVTVCSPDEAWASLRSVLRDQVSETAADAASEPVPLGTWLTEDLVLAAYRAADEVSGRARSLLGIPETTFRRKLQKTASRARAGLLSRRPSWNAVATRLEALVRAGDVAGCDVLHLARVLLLSEVIAQIDDPVRGAASMGVTARTFRRWVAEAESSEPPSAERNVLASAV